MRVAELRPNVMPADARRQRWQLSLTSEPQPIVRRKRCVLRVVTAAEAVAEMAAKDFYVHLFTDVETEMDAIVYRAGPCGVRLARQHRLGLPAVADSLPLTVSPYRTPILDEDEAAMRLCRYGLPFLFYTDPHDSRGRLMYRRYDRNLGLVQPDDGEKAGCTVVA